MKRRTLSLLLAGALALSLSACGNGGDAESAPSGAQSSGSPAPS